MTVSPLRAVPERHHWINTIVGILDQAFHLTDDEQVFAFGYVNQVLELLHIPDRSDPATLPVPLALEVSAGVYTTQLATARESDMVRIVRAVRNGDVVVSTEAWVESLMGLIMAAYPDMEPAQRFTAARYFRDLLDALGVPDRAAGFLPDDVVRIARDVDAAW
jgi:hypothetical protein